MDQKSVAAGVYKKPLWLKVVIVAVWAILVLACLITAYMVFSSTMLANDDFVETFYTYQNYKISSRVRTVVIADLHLKEFGKGNSDLLNRVEELEPDFITLAGDMFLYGSNIYDPVYELCEKLSLIAPTYYAMGNHELSEILNNGIALRQKLPETGVTLLHDSFVVVDIKGNEFVIGGLSQSRDGIEKYAPRFIERFTSAQGFRLLITHYPTNFDGYVEYEDIDLGISGHEHGGVVRLPIVGALYSADQGLFPDYTEGLIQMGMVPVVISRGLGDSYGFPRINNQPELVIIDIIPYLTEFSYR